MKGSSKLDELEGERRESLEKITKLSTLDYDPQKWEKLRKLVYEPRPLDVDVVIDDTTLREGLQMAGLLNPSPENTLKIAQLLHDMGVERLEVMTYAKTDQKAIGKMQDEGLGEVIAAWCRASQGDIDSAMKLGFEDIGISHPISHIHSQKWSKKSLSQLLERVTDAVEYATDHGLRVFVHGEDSTRASWEFEKIFIDAIAERGAEVYRICDTAGCGLPDPQAPLPCGIPAKVEQIKEETNIPAIEFHGHDDLGNAVGNTLAAIRAASGLFDKVYASTTFLGIGDRAGVAETEKIMMNCYFHHGVEKWNLEYFGELRDLIQSATKYSTPLNKAIVGDEVFAHESGIHVQGVMKLPLTYEPFPPEFVGRKRKIKIGKRSGKTSVKVKLEEIIGREVDEKDPRLRQLIELVRDPFAKGERTNPMDDSEFKTYASEAGFEIPD